ncbi:MAG TPA: hypothetical protein VLT35_06655 [Methanocella sp.]|nr:hypothetical protein [Methanocella sp.]
MRAGVLAAAIAVVLLASAVATYGYRQSWNVDPYPAVGLPTGGLTSVQPARPGPSGGLVSVDFLGQVRRQLDFGRLISLLPFPWSGGGAAGPGEYARYLGFTYERSSASPQGRLYYTGEQYDGRRIYVSATDDRPGAVPDLVFLRDGAGYTGYAISGKPAVYAYVPYAAFNVNETVLFGLANDGPVAVVLPNAAPFEIRHKEGSAWRSAFNPVAAQVITKVPNGSRREWHWDQQADDGSSAPPGDYEARINGSYSVALRIAPDTPAVMTSAVDYDPVSVEAMAGSSPLPSAFRLAYPAPNGSQREDVISIMQYKAWALGLDPEALRAAIDAAGEAGLPCLAVHASFAGEPAWVVVFRPSDRAGHGDAYVISDASGKVAFRAY